MARSMAMRCLSVVALCLFATSCVVIDERETALPAATAALALGPAGSGLERPVFFLAGAVEDEVLAELVPYRQVAMALAGRQSPESCAHYVITPLATDRPDAILIFPDSPEVTGVNTSLVYTPFTGMFTVSSAESRTTVVGYAMRAARVRLPFLHDRVTGMVREIHDRGCAPGLLEGDTVTHIGGATALPPKRWPEWGFYPLVLGWKPGDVVDVEWIRPGVGKMSGHAVMLAPVAPHAGIADSIDVTWMPKVVREQDANGRETWKIDGSWRRPESTLYMQPYGN